MNEKPAPHPHPADAKSPSTPATALADPGSTPQPINPPTTKSPSDLGD